MTDWKNLKHAYGSAEDVPALLAQMAPEPDAEVWHELWSRLCHQGSVYSASFAALPALLEAAENWGPAERMQPILLAASILDGGSAQAECEEHLRPVAWTAARFEQLCHESLQARGLPTDVFIYLLQAARSLAGDALWGRELDHLADGEFAGMCPDCGVDLYIVIGKYGFFTAAEEWIQRGGGQSAELKARPDVKLAAIEPRQGPLPGDGQRLYDTACFAGQDETAAWIRHLFGTSHCPACHADFVVQEAIAAT